MKKFGLFFVSTTFALFGCSSSMAWNEAEKDMFYNSCMFSGQKEYCRCSTKEITEKLTVGEVEQVGLKLMETGFDFSQLQSRAGKIYVKVATKCGEKYL